MARDDGSVQLLLEEYKYLSDAFLRNEELGDRRFNYFITLITGVVAAVAIREEGIIGSDGAVDPILIVALCTVLLFGLAVLVRIIKRNIATDEYIRGLSTIREYFTKQDAGIKPYLLFDPDDPPKYRTKPWKEFPPWAKGGLAETVMLLNSALAGALCVLLTYGYSKAFPWLIGALGFLLAWTLQFVYLKRRHEQKKPKEVEVETTLVIRSDDPGSIAGQIAALRTVGGFRLRPEGRRRIRDRYFDTDDERLHRAKVALRLRRSDDDLLLTVKGPSERTTWGGVQRLEIEAPWTAATRDRALEALRRAGIDLRPRRRATRAVPAQEALENLGLAVIQDRGTERTLSTVLRGNAGDDQGVAELAVDAVTYHLAPGDVRVYEVEVEAKAEDAESVTAAVTRALIAQFQPALQRWEHSKLATGKAIARLLEQGAPAKLPDGDGSLSPQAYEKIDALLRSGQL